MGTFLARWLFLRSPTTRHRQARHRKVRGLCFVSRYDYHHLYNTAAWKQARSAQLSAHPLCRMHLELGHTVPATVADHIKAHRGDLGLFLDRGNLQSLCKACHDGHKQAQEHNPGGVLRGAGLNGKPLDLAHPWHRPLPAPLGGGENSGGDQHPTDRKSVV